MAHKTRHFAWIALAAALLATLSQHALSAADTQRSAPEQEANLIKVLKSDAPPQDKAITCRQLAIYGTKQAVPALAPLLTDPELASWARIALEVIPDRAADEALQGAAAHLEGKLLIGVINSIGVRRNPQAVGILTAKLKDQDAGVASAAAEALGHIGSAAAIRALEDSLGNARSEIRQAVAYGCILSAEKLMDGGQLAEAARLYDKVRLADVNKQRKLEATRGAILARQSEGVPLLIEQLRSADAGFFAIGLRTARELSGRQVTQALAAELDQAGPERQSLLFLALADRTDEAVLPKVLELARNGPRHVRTAALGLLDRFRDLACVPVLLEAAAGNDAELSRLSRASLARLGGNDVDEDLLARLRLSSGKTRVILIDLAKQRRIEGALPIVMRSTEDADAGVRRAAVEAAGVLGTDQQAASLVRLFSITHSSDEREDIEASLLAICRRNGTRCLPHVLPIARAGDSIALRKVGLRALGSIGGAEALAVVKTALNDREEALEDEAVSVLSTWPNTWPEDSGVAEPLLALIRSGKKASHQAQGLQGYLHFIEENQKLTEAQKLAKLEELLGFTENADQKRQIIAVLGNVPSGGTLQRLLEMAADETVAEETFMAAMRIVTAKNLKGVTREQRQTALQTVIEKTKNDATRQRATAALQRIK
jgi:HEAT repeat protein